ncbi:MAG: ribosome biogenesis GTPase Der [Gammaproteobacteria bacterium]
MKPYIALVGRPNVGKSTLFNQLTGTRDALVANQPGLTRDRIYGEVMFDETACIVIDTGGLTEEKEGIDALISQQSIRAAAEADVIVFIVDGREGLNVEDQRIGNHLRKLQKPVLLAVNKSEGLIRDVVIAEFFALGLGEPFPISAAHGQGKGELIESVLALLSDDFVSDLEDEADRGIAVTILGRPNVGKSTLINRIVGEERVIAFDQPGTTRDSIDVPFERNGKKYTLIDTAGVRRRARVNEMIEKFSVIKTIRAIDNANVVVLVIDAQETVTDQDATLLGMVLDSGRALVIAVNKWDGLESDQRDWVKRELERKLRFIDFAKIHFISALHGTGVGNLFGSINKAYNSANIEVGTSKLNRILEQAITDHQPPIVRNHRIKLRFAHMSGQNPPRFVIHGNQVKSVPASYRRYLENAFRKSLKLVGTPIKIEFRQGDNPFQGQKNKMAERIKARGKRKGFDSKK